MSNFTDVGAFHEKFNLPVSTQDSKPHMLDTETEDFRVGFMQEELNEFKEGMYQRDIAMMADALIDLVYVAMGTAHMMGLPWEELWNEVQRANVSKVRAAEDGSNSKRKSSLDVVKPEGWQPPDIEGVLARYQTR